MPSPSQTQRVLAVLADGRPHTTSEIHRRAGTMRLNSRISEMRKAGHDIICEKVPGRRGPTAFRYTLLNPPPIDRNVKVFDVDPLPPEVVAPRDAANRYRIYVVPRYGEQRLIATAPDDGGVGKALITLGREGELEGCCVGLGDTHGKEDEPMEWLINPHEARW
jgi:hypothetical protein